MPDRAHRLVIDCPFNSESTAVAICRALKPETGAIEGDRAATRIEQTGDTVRITIEATDVRGLRAAKNTWFGVLQSATAAADIGNQV